jgi:hypothetical protein
MFRKVDVFSVILTMFRNRSDFQETLRLVVYIIIKIP